MYSTHTYLTIHIALLKFKLMTVKEITDIIKNLKPKYSSGVDELSNKVINHIQQIITESLTIIIKC